MRKQFPWIGITIVLLLLFSVISAAEISSQELIKRHVAARGGSDKWHKVTSLSIEGTQTTFSTPHPFNILRKRPNLYRLEQTMLRQPVVEVYDGKSAWWINGLMGNTWPLAAPPVFAKRIAREAEFMTPLLDEPGNGQKVELAGREPFEGHDAYRLKVTRKDGLEETWYLDPKTYLEVARISKTVDFGEEMEERSYFSDWKPVGGLILPHRVDVEYGTRNMILEVGRVTINAPIDDAAFVQPKPEGMTFLEPIVGEWTLKIETRQHPRAPWEANMATSVITPLVDSGLLEERIEYQESGLPAKIVRSWSFDQFRKVYRITQTDNYSFMMNLLEGTVTDGKLTAGNAKSGTTVGPPPDAVWNRLLVHDVGAGGFAAEWESSRDEGKTWNTDVKYTYSRK